LYLVYIVGWALLNPKIAPKLPADKYRVPVPEWLQKLERGPAKRVFASLLGAVVRPSVLAGARAPGGKPVGYWLVVKNALALLVPAFMAIVLFAAAWWYVVIHNAPEAAAPTPVSSVATPAPAEEAKAPGALAEPPAAQDEEKTQELGAAESDVSPQGVPEKEGAPTEVGGLAQAGAQEGVGQVPESFYTWFWTFAVLTLLVLAVYYARMDGEQLEILKMLEDSVVPLGVLTFVVLAVILFGITTASESAGVGAVGALYVAGFAKYPKRTLWSSFARLVIGLGLGSMRADLVTLIVSGSLGAIFAGTAVPFAWDLLTTKQLKRNILESTFLTAKTTAMVCWLFVGSALFSAVFALHGGQQLIEKWVLSFQLTPLQFLILSQAIIFLLGWPLEWTEIIVIFVPIFIPLLTHFQVDPVLFATMVAVNLQAAFLSPPVAMSAFYLKGVAPKHVTLNQIFAGMMPYMLIVILCLVFMYIWP